MQKPVFISVFLALTLIMANARAETSGNCGVRSGAGTENDPYIYADNCKWSFDEATGTFSDSGTGAMGEYGGALYSGRYHTSAPWAQFDTQITNVKIENGITSLGMSAFEGLINLKHVDIPNSVTNIGYAAFYDSRSLTELKLPDNPNFTSVSGSFYGMVALKNLVVPDSVNYIGPVSFAYCPQLESLIISDDMALGKIFQFNNEIWGDFEKLKIYCVGDTSKCDENLHNAGYPDLKTLKATSQKANGVVYIKDKNGNIVGTSGERLNKRIYSVEEAAIVSKPAGNRLKIRYK